MSTPFIEDNDQTRARREHLESIRELIGNAYPNKFSRSHLIANPSGEDTITAVVEAFRNYFPAPPEGTRPTAEQLEHFNAVLKQQTDGMAIAGRIATPPRLMGKAAFVHLSDGRERLQIYVRRDDVQMMTYGQRGEQTIDGWRLFQLLDHGDFIGVEGFLFITKTGELSIHVRRFEFLTKALQPMPDKLHGISDPEIRQRQRYADLIASSLKVEREEGEMTTREIFERRSRLITEMRRFLDSHGYVEVETPMLSPIASGAAARPFKTHHNALDIDLYLRIAPELYLKRLLVGGFERVYELNRNFRNEGIGYRWNPEFTMLEFYCAYMDVNGMMDFCEEMLRTTIKEVIGGMKVRYDTSIIAPIGAEYRSDPINPSENKLFLSYSGLPLSFEWDFSQPFRRFSMKQAVVEYLSDEFKALSFEDNKFSEKWMDNLRLLRLLSRLVQVISVDFAPLPKYLSAESEAAKTYQLEFGKKVKEWWPLVIEEAHKNEAPAQEAEDIEVAKHIEFLFEQVAESNLMRPTFIYDYPKPISPLSKASPSNPMIAERFELFIGGMEIGNGFSELNDPVEQYARFEEQAQQRERGDDEAMQMDVDYVRALSYGMPPAAGIGIGIDRLTMLLTNRRTIRDVILFPHMRPQRQTETAETDAAEGDAAGTDASPEES